MDSCPNQGPPAPSLAACSHTVKASVKGGSDTPKQTDQQTWWSAGWMQALNSLSCPWLRRIWSNLLTAVRFVVGFFFVFFTVICQKGTWFRHNIKRCRHHLISNVTLAFILRQERIKATTYCSTWLNLYTVYVIMLIKFIPVERTTVSGNSAFNS